MSDTPVPTQITLHKQTKTLEVVFDSGEQFILPFEYLRVFSPSASERDKVVMGKQDVTIVSLEPVGHYAIKPTFDDGHATGIYSWHFLYELGAKQQLNWQQYLERSNSHG